MPPPNLATFLPSFSHYPRILPFPMSGRATPPSMSHSPYRKRKRQRNNPPPSSTSSPPSESPFHSPRRTFLSRSAVGIDTPCSNSSQAAVHALEIDAVRSRLLDWYVENYRELPWRLRPSYRKGCGVGSVPKVEGSCSAGSPYAIWVSEVMSQQTRLCVVEGYYKRWMSEFPSIEALAEAPLERVNELWAGLGYYRRARFLHQGAKQVVEEYGGELPGDVEKLLGIRGIGRYTAGAISSIAFGKAVAVVDGNVKRVLARLYPGMGGKDGVVEEAKYWEMAGELVEGVECVGDLNQAMMELGAMVCKPRGAECGKCPLREVCGAYKEAVERGEDAATYVTRYPVKDVRKVVKVRDERVAVMVVVAEKGDERRFLIMQRPEEGLLGGLWEAPNVVVKGAGKGCVDAAFERVHAMVGDVPRGSALDEEVVERWGKADLLVDVGNVKHVFSHIRQSLDVRAGLFRDWGEKVGVFNEGVGKGNVPFRWVSEKELGHAAISTQMRKVFAAAKKKLPKARRIRRKSKDERGEAFC